MRSRIVTGQADRFVPPPLGRFAAYPEYRHSGIEWLREIPAHWEVKPLKRLATLNDEAISESTDSSFEIAYVDISSVDPVAGITDKETLDFENAPSRARRLVRHGDVIVSTVRNVSAGYRRDRGAGAQSRRVDWIRRRPSPPPSELLRRLRAPSAALRGERGRELRRSQLSGHQRKSSRLLSDPIPRPR